MKKAVDSRKSKGTGLQGKFRIGRKRREVLRICSVKRKVRRLILGSASNKRTRVSWPKGEGIKKTAVNKASIKRA